MYLILPILIIVIITILLSGFFSGAEIAFFSISDFKIQTLSKQKNKNIGYLLKLKENPDKVLITILICNNLVNIGSASVITFLITTAVGSQGVGIATGVMTLAILTFGEILPKSIANKFAVPFSVRAAKILYFLQFVLAPIIWIFEKVSQIPQKFMKNTASAVEITDEDVVSMAAISFNQGKMLEYEKDTITNILRLNDTQVKKILTPKEKITMAPSDMTLHEVVHNLRTKHYSRIPIYTNTQDNIVGFIFLRDILDQPKEKWKELKAQDISREPLIAKDTDLVHMVYQKLLKKRAHLVIVTNRSQKLVGMLTLEDIIEEVLGEIYDETDPR